MSQAQSARSFPANTAKGRLVRRDQLEDEKRDINLRALTATGTSLVDRAARATDIKFDHIIKRSEDDPIPYPLSARNKAARQNKLSTIDMMPIIQERLMKQRYYIRNLFCKMDSYNQGFITRTSLLKVICTICPSIQIEQFHQILTLTGLDEMTMITYNDFERHILGRNAKNSNKTVVPTSLVKSGQGRNLSVAFAHQLLRERLLDEGIDPHTVFPESCFFTSPPGIVLKPQLQDALTMMGITMSPEDYAKLWNRFDDDGVGSVDFKVFMKKLKSGHVHASSKSAPPTQRVSNSSRIKSPVRFYGDHNENPQVTHKDPQSPHGNQDRPRTPKVENVSSHAPAGGKYQHRLQLLGTHRPQLSDVMQNLQYIFEEAYYAMLVTLQRHGHNSYAIGKELIPTLEFCRILTEYGVLSCDANGEDDLTKSAAYRVLSGMVNQMNASERSDTMVNYATVLKRLMSRGPGTLSHQMWPEMRSIYANAGKQPSFSAAMSKEDLIKNLLQLLHHEYWKFLSQIEHCDQDRTGIIDETNLRSCIRTVLGRDLPEKQWQEFLHNMGVPQNEEKHLVNVLYDKQLLPHFKEPSGACKSAVGVSVPPLNKPPILAPITPKRRDANDDFWKTESARSVPELGPYVGSMLKRRFHRFDKAFKNECGTNEVKITKEQFYRIVTSVGVTLNRREMESLWNTMPPDAATTWHYHQVMRHFILMASPKRNNTGPTRNRMNFNPEASEFHKERLRDFRAHKKEEKAKEVDRLKKKMAEFEQNKKDYKSVPEAVKMRLLDKIRPAVRKNFRTILEILRQLDVYGYCYVDYHVMLRLNEQLNFGLSSEDAFILCRAFDPKASGKFRYLGFMRNFSDDPTHEEGSSAYSTHSTQLVNQVSGQSVRLVDLLNTIRYKLISEHRSLLAAFRKMDSQKCGCLDVTAFVSVMKRAGIVLSHSDLYHLLTELDRNCDGMVDYEEFLTKVVEICSNK